MKIKSILILIAVILLLVSIISIRSWNNAVKKSNDYKNSYLNYQDSLLSLRKGIVLTKSEFEVFEKSLYDSIRVLNIRPKDVTTIVKWKTKYLRDTVIDTLYINNIDTNIIEYHYNYDCLSFDQSINCSKNIVKTFNIEFNSNSTYIGYKERPVSIFFNREVKWFWKRKQNFVRIETTCGESVINKVIKIK